jgi:hypothetical protein
MTFFIEQNGAADQPQPTPPEPVVPLRENGLSAGSVLKARRLELGLKHKDIARDIKIKVEYLKAIEDEEFDSLPTPQYLRLFLRTYAEYLKLDVQEIYALYDTQERPPKVPEKKDTRYPVQLPPTPLGSRLKTYIIAAVGSMIVLFVLVVWLFGPDDEQSSTTPLNQTQIDAEPAGRPSQTPAETAAADPLEAGRHVLYVHAFDSTWMVIQADNDTVFIGFIEANESATWIADSVFALSLTHVGGVEAALNGQYLKPFGSWGGPVEAREVGRHNLESYLDSTRLNQPAPKAVPQ